MTTHRHAYAKPVPLPIATTQGLLLVVAGLFGSIFAWSLFSPISILLALIVAVAVAVIGLNFAEGYLVRFAIAAYRFGFKKLGLITAAGVVLIASYSIVAGSNVIESYLIKKQHSSLATDYDVAAAEQRILSAKSKALNSLDFKNSQTDFYKTASEENAKITDLLRNKSASVSSANPSTVAKIVSFAIEVAIIGLAAFVEIFLKPTPLPALVKFNNKLVEWSLNDKQLQNLEIAASPSAGTVSLPEQAEIAPTHENTRLEGVDPSVYVHVEVNESHFKAWVTLITSEAIKPTVKDCKKYLRTQHKYSMEDAQKLAGEFLERGYNLGYLDLNDQKGAFASQYVLASKKLIAGGVICIIKLKHSQIISRLLKCWNSEKRQSGKDCNSAQDESQTDKSK